ncbi:uncharacterized protein V6R79_000095 [Siganus canaliculatus]
MRSVAWNILVLSLALSATAQESKKCPAPLSYPHTKLEEKYARKTIFFEGEKVYYRCHDDFLPSRGFRTVQCKNGGWTKLTLKCEKRSCGNAGALPNGQFFYEGNSFIGEKVYAQCDEGFTLKGIDFMVCKKTGWTGDLPSCEVQTEESKKREEVTCSVPAVANAQSSDGGLPVYRVGESATFTCIEGFQLDGTQQITCGPDGQWQTPPPQCLPVPEEKEEVTCSAPVVANAQSSDGGLPVYQVGDSVTLTCSEGFQLDGTQQITCGPDGQWQTPPRCLPVPDKTQVPVKEAGHCSVPLVTRNSHTILPDKYATKSSFASGEKVYYLCEIGYVPAGGSRYRRCVEGKWTTLRLRCELKSCGSAGELLNGQLSYTGVEFGDTVTAVCDEGYHLVGQATRNCMVDGWDGRVPVCEVAQCEEPPEVMNADMAGVQEPPYTYRSVVRYQCRSGILTGLQDIWCTENGTWSTPPACKDITCPAPHVPNASWAGSWNQLYRFRDSITIECNPGFTMIGKRFISCNVDGKWYPGLPRCTRVSPRAYYKRGNYGR